MTSWAEIVRANIPKEYLARINEYHNKRIEQHNTRIKQQKQAKLKASTDYFIKIVQKQYGEFWYFYVERELNEKIKDGKYYKWNYFIRTHIQNLKEKLKN